MLGDANGLHFTRRQRRNLGRLRIAAVCLSVPSVVFWLSMSYHAYLVTHAFEEWSGPTRVLGDVWFVAILLASMAFLTPALVVFHWGTGPEIRITFVVTMLSIGLISSMALIFGGDVLFFRSYVTLLSFEEVRAAAVSRIGSDVTLVWTVRAAWASGASSIVGAAAGLFLSAGRDYGEGTAHAREVRSLVPYG